MKLTTYDVKSLFLLIILDIFLDSKLSDIKTRLKLKIILKVCINQNYFKFSDKTL